MASYYQNSDLFILPATEEPASISVLESIGMGTPAICSDTNGTRFYLTENKFGLTFVDNDIESLYPEIAKEAIGWDPSKFLYGSHTKMQWECKRGHKWSAEIRNRIHTK